LLKILVFLSLGPEEKLQVLHWISVLYSSKATAVLTLILVLFLSIRMFVAQHCFFVGGVGWQ